MKNHLLLLFFFGLLYPLKAQPSGPLPAVLADFVRQPTKSELADFSLAGYHLGRELPPRRGPAGLPMFRVTDYGAIPDDGQDDIDAIQRAVDAAGQAGGGIVQFPQGVFDFDVSTTHRFVSIPYSNVIVRGYGDGPDGTILHDHNGSTYHDFRKKWLAGLFPSFFKMGARARDTTVYSVLDDPANLATPLAASAQKGDTVLNVRQPKALKVGAVYLLTQKNTDTTLVERLAYPLKREQLSSGHTIAGNVPGAHKTQCMVRVLEIEGNRVRIDAPLLYEIDARYEPALWHLPGLVEESGIENLRLVTNWSEEFYHHKNPTHDNGWDAIKLDMVADCWVRRITFKNITTAVGLINAKNCVVYDSRIIGNPGHNGFVIAQAATRNLFFRLQGGEQMHTYSLSGYVSGNVFTSCYMGPSASIDSHGSLAMHNLFDNIRGGLLRNGGSNPVVSPLHARSMVLWNWGMGMLNPYNHRIEDHIGRLEKYPGLIAVGIFSLHDRPVYFIGPANERIASDYQSPWATISQFGQKPTIPSLYEFQHLLRYGAETPVER